MTDMVRITVYADGDGFRAQVFAPNEGEPYASTFGPFPETVVHSAAAFVANLLTPGPLEAKVLERYRRGADARAKQAYEAQDDDTLPSWDDLEPWKRTAWRMEVEDE